jgi:lysozyme family protein
MEGVYTINIDGSGEQQVSDNGSSPSWQPIITEETTGTVLGVPNTGVESINQANFIPMYIALTVVVVSVVILAFRKHFRQVNNQKDN